VDRFGFVMEQTLGHRTHYRNLRRYVEEDASVLPTWMPIAFEPTGAAAKLPLLRGNWSARASWRAQRAVAAARAQTRFDALLYHTQVTALLSPYQRGVPIVVSLDATPINYDTVGAYYGHPAGGPLEALKQRANRQAFAHASALIVWRQWAKDSLIHDYGVPAEKVHVISPGVDLAQWPQVAPEDRLRASDGWLPRVLFVGGDFERKGGRLLLECFERWFVGRCELDLVTQTPLTTPPGARLHTDLTPNSDELKRLYAQADIFVFPTLADCAPLAVPEAMAASLPIITTYVGAIPEMVQDGVNGLLVRPGDLEALRGALERLLDAPDLRIQMGNTARALAERFDDAGRNAQRVLDVLREVSAQARARTGGAVEGIVS
jgi:glycosyltransferase involved in cell wall biosynthesis